jgi:putative transposase
VKELCGRPEISAVTFYRWKSKFEGMEISEMRRQRLLEEENTRLKKIVAKQAPDLEVLKVVVSKKWQARGREAVWVAHEEGQLIPAFSQNCL